MPFNDECRRSLLRRLRVPVHTCLPAACDAVHHSYRYLDRSCAGYHLRIISRVDHPFSVHISDISFASPYRNRVIQIEHPRHWAVIVDPERMASRWFAYRCQGDTPEPGHAPDTVARGIGSPFVAETRRTHSHTCSRDRKIRAKGGDLCATGSYGFSSNGERGSSYA